MSNYYADKAAVLADVFGAQQVDIDRHSIVVDGRRFPIVDDVVVLLEPGGYTRRVLRALETAPVATAHSAREFASDIQHTFGQEWKAYPEILAEHEDEFRQYFDLVDVDALANATVCDLGCGSGRWSYFLRTRCRQLILVDFSDAIFIARENLRDCANALFFMADLTNLPLRQGFADLVVCLGVLHHLPLPALYEVRRLKRFAPRVLVYLYYALDNRPAHFRALLAVVTGVRKLTSRTKSPITRSMIAWTLTVGVYVPVLALGRSLRWLRLGALVPLHDSYGSKSLQRIHQDVYDRFFTRIEQRTTRSSVLKLKDTFASVTVSPSLPYWHFLCESATETKGLGVRDSQ
jgi:SAM-dependent methyltransferase